MLVVARRFDVALGRVELRDGDGVDAIGDRLIVVASLRRFRANTRRASRFD
jgi:hypothetical protein